MVTKKCCHGTGDVGVVGSVSVGVIMFVYTRVCDARRLTDDAVSGGDQLEVAQVRPDRADGGVCGQGMGRGCKT